jgi:hypothetical protein
VTIKTLKSGMFYNNHEIPKSMPVAALYDHRTTFYLAQHPLNGLPPKEHMQKLLDETERICIEAGAQRVDYQENRAGRAVVGYKSTYVLGNIFISNHVSLTHDMRLGTPKSKKKTAIAQDTIVHVDEMTLDQLLADKLLRPFEAYYPRKSEQNGKRLVVQPETTSQSVEPNYVGQLKLF